MRFVVKGNKKGTSCAPGNYTSSFNSEQHVMTTKNVNPPTTQPSTQPYLDRPNWQFVQPQQ